MSVYGDMLGFFPELRRAFKYYSMSPNPIAGYETRANESTIYGTLQNVRAGSLDVEGDTLNATNVPLLWSRSTLEQGYFIEDDAVQYRISKSNNWKREGAFTVYQLESIKGVTNTQVKDTDVTLGIGFYD